MAAVLSELREESGRMRHPVRLILMIFLVGMAVLNVRRGNALDAAIDSAGAVAWLWVWAEDA